MYRRPTRVVLGYVLSLFSLKVTENTRSEVTELDSERERKINDQIGCEFPSPESRMKNFPYGLLIHLDFGGVINRTR